MLRHECSRRCRTLAAGLAWALLALIGAGAHAANLAAHEMRPGAAAAAADERIPAAMDCDPCALCFVAPAPGPHTFTVDAKETGPRILFAAASSASAVFRFPARSTRREHVPIRIAFCRWLD